MMNNRDTPDDSDTCSIRVLAAERVAPSEIPKKGPLEATRSPDLEGGMETQKAPPIPLRIGAAQSLRGGKSPPEGAIDVTSLPAGEVERRNRLGSSKSLADVSTAVETAVEAERTGIGQLLDPGSKPTTTGDRPSWWDEESWTAYAAPALLTDSKVLKLLDSDSIAETIQSLGAWREQGSITLPSKLRTTFPWVWRRMELAAQVAGLSIASTNDIIVIETLPGTMSTDIEARRQALEGYRAKRDFAALRAVNLTATLAEGLLRAPSEQFLETCDQNPGRKYLARLISIIYAEQSSNLRLGEQKALWKDTLSRQDIIAEVAKVLGNQEAATLFVGAVDTVMRSLVRRALNPLRDDGKTTLPYWAAEEFSKYWTDTEVVRAAHTSALAKRLERLCQAQAASGPTMLLRCFPITTHKVMEKTTPPSDWKPSKKGEDYQKVVKKTALVKPKLTSGPMLPAEEQLTKRLNVALSQIESDLGPQVGPEAGGRPEHWLSRCQRAADKLRNRVESLESELRRRRNELRQTILVGRGVIVPKGKPKGTTQTLQEATISPLEWQKAAALYLERNGTKGMDAYNEGLQTMLQCDTSIEAVLELTDEQLKWAIIRAVLLEVPYHKEVPIRTEVETYLKTVKPSARGNPPAPGERPLTSNTESTSKIPSPSEREEGGKNLLALMSEKADELTATAQKAAVALKPTTD